MRLPVVANLKQQLEPSTSVRFKVPSSNSVDDKDTVMNCLDMNSFSGDLLALLKNMCSDLDADSGWIAWVAPQFLPCRSIFALYDLPVEKLMLIHPRMPELSIDLAMQALDNPHVSGMIVSVNQFFPHQKLLLQSGCQRSVKPTLVLHYGQTGENLSVVTLSVQDYFDAEPDNISINTTSTLSSQLCLFSSSS